MPWGVDIRRRRREPEIMDQPGLDPGQHAAALRGLERINRLSRSSAILWGPIRELAKQQPGRQLSLLDLATGAGDIPIDLWQRAHAAGIPLAIEACDRSDVALSHAGERARRHGANIHFFQHDILTEAFPRRYDAVVCSLFLHHLESDDVVTVLRRMAGAAEHLVLVNDLNRSAAGWWLAWAGTRILTRSPVAHVDGPLSVAGAFTREEARGLAERAGLRGATVQSRFPCRWLLSWRRPAEGSAHDGGR